LSLGFRTAGFELAGAIEFDPVAIRTHARNFFPNDKALHGLPLDITKIDPTSLVAKLDPSLSPELAIDVVVGGPPCQAFARVGRAKLREIGAHPQAFLHDPRGRLFHEFLAYVEALRPVAVLMENVPDVLNYGGYNVAEEVCRQLEALGYAPRYTLLNSAHYGVPQLRDRAFVLAMTTELAQVPIFPSPTHWVDLPRGYQGTRFVAFKGVRVDLFNQRSFYVEPPRPSQQLPPAVTAREALQDLPRITAHLEGTLKRGTRRFDTEVPYPGQRSLSDYAGLMRSWTQFEARGGLTDHVIRWLPRDYPIFRRMHAGDQYPEAHTHAMQILGEKLRHLDGGVVSKQSAKYTDLLAKTVPPYDPTKFPNRWRKMDGDQPARTLMAHIGKDSYTHIHYDSDQARTISVREAARLQSFPDGFIFEGRMNDAFRQIGNAVPPLLAAAIARGLMRQLRQEVGYAASQDSS
jgi:DNA (cytosine-5)-methyltransferase 1